MHGSGESGGVLGIAVLALVLAAPILLWVVGLTQRKRGAPAAPAFDFALMVNSALLYALAFNVTFFIQELFLVIPKALTPGLNPTLFHNNHTWAGTDEVAHLYQGTGAVAVVVSGLIFLTLIRVAPKGPLRMFAIWMAYHGLMMGLPQAPSGVLAPSTDFGQAMNYLHLSQTAQLAIGIAGLLAMAGSGLLLTRPVLELADTEGRVATPRARASFVVNAAVLPAIIAVLLIVPFRIPTSPQNVLAPPILIAWFGVSWIYASAWLQSGAIAKGVRSGISWAALALLLALLAIFQLVLRPGVQLF